jgi:hypothetical protein
MAKSPAPDGPADGRQRFRTGRREEAVAIPEHVLIAAADALGVMTKRGEWLLPGQRQDRGRLKN